MPGRKNGNNNNLKEQQEQRLYETTLKNTGMAMRGQVDEGDEIAQFLSSRRAGRLKRVTNSISFCPPGDLFLSTTMRICPKKNAGTGNRRSLLSTATRKPAIATR